MDRSYFLKTLLSLPFGGWVANRIKSDDCPNTYLLNTCYVAGFQYYEGPKLIEKIQVGEELSLKATLDNSYDQFAVEIFRDHIMLGHLPRTDNKHISRMLKQEVPLKCMVEEVNPKQHTWKMLKIHIYLRA